MDVLSISTAPPLPEVTGAKIDRSSLTVGDSGALVHYISSDVDFATATQAIIIVHGVKRDAYNAFANVQGAVDAAKEGGVVVMAPVFFNGNDKGEFPFENGVATSNELVWKGNGWSEGGNNQYPTSIHDVSSFDALDAAIAYFADKDKFPMIRHVVLAGHSAGGQTVQRYTILGSDAPTGVILRYVIADPSSYAYFSPQRLKPVPADCTAFNDWKYGLKNYQLTYHADLLSTQAARIQLRVRYLTREVWYLCGTADVGAEDQGCEAKTQGSGRLERCQLFWKYLTETYPGSWIDTIQKIGFAEGIAHDAAALWKSEEGQTALFSL